MGSAAKGIQEELLVEVMAEVTGGDTVVGTVVAGTVVVATAGMEEVGAGVGEEDVVAKKTTQVVDRRHYRALMASCNVLKFHGRWERIVNISRSWQV